MHRKLFVGLLSLTLVIVGFGALFVVAEEAQHATGRAGSIVSPIVDPNSIPGGCDLTP
jgi:hypothetical protein